jgi:hypothetical protein
LDGGINALYIFEFSSVGRAKDGDDTNGVFIAARGEEFGSGSVATFFG